MPQCLGCRWKRCAGWMRIRKQLRRVVPVFDSEHNIQCYSKPPRRSTAGQKLPICAQYPMECTQILLARLGDLNIAEGVAMYETAQTFTTRRTMLQSRRLSTKTSVRQGRDREMDETTCTQIGSTVRMGFLTKDSRSSSYWIVAAWPWKVPTLTRPFRSHWSEYAVDRVRSWRKLTQACDLATLARNTPERVLSSTPRLEANHHPLPAGGMAHAA